MGWQTRDDFSTARQTNVDHSRQPGNSQLSGRPDHSDHQAYYAVVLPESSSRCQPTTSAMRMTIHLSAVCEISQDLRYLSPASSRLLIGCRSISARDERAESSATACEIADEVRSNLFFGLDVWICGEPECVPRCEPCQSARRAQPVKMRTIPTNPTLDASKQHPRALSLQHLSPVDLRNLWQLSCFEESILITASTTAAATTAPTRQDVVYHVAGSTSLSLY
jgi:hypothetical protein